MVYFLPSSRKYKNMFSITITVVTLHVSEFEMHKAFKKSIMRYSNLKVWIEL